LVAGHNRDIDLVLSQIRGRCRDEIVTFKALDGIDGKAILFQHINGLGNLMLQGGVRLGPGRFVLGAQFMPKRFAAIGANGDVRLIAREGPYAFDRFHAHGIRIRIAATDVPEHVRDRVQIDQNNFHHSAFGTTRSSASRKAFASVIGTSMVCPWRCRTTRCSTTEPFKLMSAWVCLALRHRAFMRLLMAFFSAGVSGRRGISSSSLSWLISMAQMAQ